VFDELLNWLFHGRWLVLSAAQVVRGVEHPDLLPARAALLTFDGACRTVLDNALPILRKYRFPAVTFVPTDLVGRTVALDGLDDPISVCTWEDLQHLDGNEISVQSNGVTHRRFFGLDPAQQEREAVASCEAIEAHVGRPPKLFAYPHGDPGNDPAGTARILELAGYRGAFLVGGGVNKLPGADRYRLARIAVGPDTDLGSVLGA
jgi:peptidoglycan/xylan/chitin deacetylase (PgdA/CDA1 family)